MMSDSAGVGRAGARVRADDEGELVMAKFRSGDKIVDAFRWTGTPDQYDGPEWMIEAIESGTVFFLCAGTPDVRMVIGRLHGHDMAALGDWIIRDGSGNISAWTPVAFAAAHQPFSGD
jgi:hypothetical protein